MAARKISVEIVGDASQLEKAFGTAGKSTSKFEQGISKASKVAGGALAALGLGAKKTADEASALGESVNAINVVFGKSADKLHAFAKVADKEAGLSMRAFNELVTPVGASLRNVGFSADEAATASIDLAKRAADMASVFNVDVSEALSAIQSGLRGEADPLEAFGVGLSAAAVDAHALEKGLAKTAKELTANDKAQARLSLIMEQSNKVAGDFKNTSDSVANAQRINAAAAENTSAKIGKGLLPVMQTFQGVLEKVTTFMSENVAATKVAAAVIGGLAVAVLAVNAGMKLYAAGAAVVTAAQWAWNVAMSANPLGLIVIGLVALGAALVVAYKKSETFREIVDGAFSAVKKIAEGFVDFFTEDIPGAFKSVLGWVKSNWPEIATIISGPFAPLVALATDAFGIRSKLEGAFTSIATWVDTKVGEAAGFITGLPGRIADFGAKLLSTFTTYFGGAGLGGWVSGKIGEFAGFITGIPGRIADFGTNLFSRFTTFFGGAGIGGWVTGRVGEWAGFIAGIPGRIVDFGADLFKTVIGFITGAGIGTKITEKVKDWADLIAALPGKAASGIKEKASDLWNAVTDIFDKLPDFVKKILGISSPSKVFMQIGHDVVAGIVTGLKSKASELRDAAIDMAKELAGDAWDALSGVGKGIAGAVGGAAGKVGGILGGGGGEGTPGGGGTAGKVYGDVAGLTSAFMARLHAMSGGHGLPIFVQSGFRTYAEQAALVAQKGLWSPSNPTGAAAPGTSKHEKGIAADITPGKPSWPFVGNYGLQFPIAQEPWHVETYDQGGWLMPGKTLAINKTGRPEAVVPAGRLGGGLTINVNLNGPVFGDDRERVARDLGTAMYAEIIRQDRRNGGRMVNYGASVLN